MLLRQLTRPFNPLTALTTNQYLATLPATLASASGASRPADWRTDARRSPVAFNLPKHSNRNVQFSTMAPKIKLYYFDVRARAEFARVILAQAGAEYEDVRLKGEDWAKMKPSKSI